VYLPWWVLLAGLAASAFAAYVLLGRTQAGDSPWVLFPLTAALAPVLFLGTAVAGITVSVVLSMLLLEDRSGAPTGPPEPPPARTERTSQEATSPEGTHLSTTLERTVPATTASPTASPSASPTASPSAAPSASAGARTPPR
jgi:hypothetical protein